MFLIFYVLANIYGRHHSAGRKMCESHLIAAAFPSLVLARVCAVLCALLLFVVYGHVDQHSNGVFCALRFTALSVRFSKRVETLREQQPVRRKQLHFEPSEPAYKFEMMPLPSSPY